MAMSWLKTILLVVMALFYIAAGINHFVNPRFYLKIMPPYLPWHEALNIISGAAEVILGVLLLVPATRVWAAWGIIALLIAIFPANVNVYFHQDLIPAPSWVHLLRLPLQGVLILWAWWYTR
jgi:uncharacterized membrane protein